MANTQKPTASSSPAGSQQQANGGSNSASGVQNTPAEAESREEAPRFSASRGSLYNNVDGEPVAGDTEENARLGIERVRAFLIDSPTTFVFTLPPRQKQNGKK